MLRISKHLLLGRCLAWPRCPALAEPQTAPKCESLARQRRPQRPHFFPKDPPLSCNCPEYLLRAQSFALRSGRGFRVPQPHSPEVSRKQALELAERFSELPWFTQDSF